MSTPVLIGLAVAFVALLVLAAACAAVVILLAGRRRIVSTAPMGPSVAIPTASIEAIEPELFARVIADVQAMRRHRRRNVLTQELIDAAQEVLAKRELEIKP